MAKAGWYFNKKKERKDPYLSLGVLSLPHNIRFVGVSYWLTDKIAKKVGCLVIKVKKLSIDIYSVM